MDQPFNTQFSDENPHFSVVVPAFKEEAVIESTLKTIHTYLSMHNILEKTEIVVVAADGHDETSQIAKEYSLEFPHFQLIEPGAKVGKGRDVRLGMLAARGDYILFTDADLATPFEYVLPMFEMLEDSNDVVIGVRNLKSIHKGYRSYLSRGSNLLTRFVILPKISDTQCGFKGFSNQAAKTIFQKASIAGWSFDIEVLALARMYNYSIGEIYIDDWCDPKLNAGFVGENPVKAIFRSLFELGVIRYRFWTGKYKN